MATLRKHTQNLIIDAVSFALLILLLVTGFVVHYILPPRSHGETLLGLERHDWGEIHFWIAVFFSTIIFIHLIMHYSWIKASVLPRDESKRRKVLLLIALILYGIVILAASAFIL